MVEDGPSTGKDPAFAPGASRRAVRAGLAALLRRAGVESADLDARLLVCAAADISHTALVADPDVPLDEGELARVAAFAQRRLAREPVSRILARREFWGLSLAVGPAVLDPRPDTEGVVAAVLNALRGRENDPLRLLDLGTGSGAILLALLHELPNAFGVGVERSAGACRVAAANVAATGSGGRAALVRGSWTDALAGRFDVVVSNPPYIPSGAIAGLAPDVRDHDPAEALDGGPDGLDAYRALLPHLPALLAPRGVAAVECGWDQAPAVAGLMRASGLAGVVVSTDLAGHERVVVARPCG